MINKPIKLELQNLPISIIFPVILSVVLFSMTIFLLILPSLESTLMANRRELIRNLTEVALSTVRQYEAKERSGELSRKQAQALAMQHLRRLRYGAESLDYFWINDMHPNMIMHPYRTDLEGKDISDYADPNGKRLFTEFVKIVRRQGSGYEDYMWQWKDDPQRVVLKLSFVKGFKPWNWIVGTGLYIDDIHTEIKKITQKLTLICLGILLTLFVLSFFIISQSVKVEKERQRAESQSKQQQEQLFHAAKMVSVGTLVSGVAHEVNNPATSIMMNAPLLKKIWNSFMPIIDEYGQNQPNFQISGMSYATLRERIPMLLNHIEDGARRIKDIVTELKDYARSKPSEMNDEINVSHSVRKAVALLSNLIHKTTNFLSLDYRMDLPLIRGNAQKIEQVVINLLVNACQALKNRKDRISIRTNYDEISNCVSIEIIDTGVGIEFEVLDRIKDPFFTTKQESGNTGLGLAISDRIIKDHGGKIQFTSYPGKGTNVVVQLPVNNKAGAKKYK